MYLFESHVTYISIKLFMFGMYVWFAGRSWVFFSVFYFSCQCSQKKSEFLMKVECECTLTFFICHK